MHSVPITTKVVSSNTTHDEVYSIQHDITEIFFRMVLNTLTPPNTIMTTMVLSVVVISQHLMIYTIQQSPFNKVPPTICHPHYHAMFQMHWDNKIVVNWPSQKRPPPLIRGGPVSIRRRSPIKVQYTQLPMHSVPITTKVVSSTTTNDEVYSIQHDITEIFFRMVLNTLTPPSPHQNW
jgi:hypothetical protein